MIADFVVRRGIDKNRDRLVANPIEYAHVANNFRRSSELARASFYSLVAYFDLH